MPIRNPFAKRPDVSTGLQPFEEGNRPLAQNNGTRPSFEKVDTMGSKSSSAMSIASRKSMDPPEYKLSVVNDSGVYLPPSPPEKKGIWPRRSNPSGASISTRRSEDIEQFSISRESFDSYRRSFDISARSPVMRSEINGRQSLDSARLPRLPRSAAYDRNFEKPAPTAEEGFEDVGLNDEARQQTKKKSFFSKFGDSSENAQSSTSRFHIGGRKRGQSGVGEELGNIQRADNTGSSEVNEAH